MNGLILASVILGAPVPEHLMKERWPVGTGLTVGYNETFRVKAIFPASGGKPKRYHIADGKYGHEWAGWVITEGDLIRTINDPFASWMERIEVGDYREK